MTKMFKALTDFSVNSKVSTMNVLAVLLVLGFSFNSSFATIWILVHSNNMTEDTKRLVFEVTSQTKEIIFLILGFIAKGYYDKTKNNEK